MDDETAGSAGGQKAASPPNLNQIRGADRGAQLLFGLLAFVEEVAATMIAARVAAASMMTFRQSTLMLTRTSGPAGQPDEVEGGTEAGASPTTSGGERDAGLVRDGDEGALL